MEDTSNIPGVDVRTISRVKSSQKGSTPREPEDIDGDLESEVERIVKREIITYVRRRR